MLRRLLVLLLMCSASGAARAQDLNGVVRDSATGTPVMGAVIAVLDPRGTSITRTVTGARGEFALTDLGDRATTMRLVRLGFRPMVRPIPQDWSQRADMEISLVRLPTLLETVRVTADVKCDPKRGNILAQGLLQQARAGLLTTIVGREANPARFVRLSYERTLLGKVDTISPSVRTDSTTGTTSFRAMRKGADLVQLGFTADSLGTGIYFGPDAEVLLDEGFEAGYCFSVVNGPGDQVGLTFSPAAPKRIGRVDVEGTLWIDSKARALTKLEYRYVGLGRAHDDLKVGGSVAYREMPNGSVIVTEWSVRLLKDRIDSVRMPNGLKAAIPRLVVSDGGAVVARATWKDGTVWKARLATATITAVHGETGDRLPNATVRLRNTNYLAATDAKGVVTITDVLPGRYAVDVINPELVEYGLTATWDDPNLRSADSTVTRGSRTQIEEIGERTMRTFIARAGETVKHVAPMQTPAQVAARCASGRAVIGQVKRANGAPGDSVAVWAEGTPETVLTTPAGGFILCIPPKYTRDVLDLGGQGRGASVVDTRIKLEGAVMFVRLILGG